MTDKDKLFLQISKPEDFVFDERVAGVFDDMVARSVPFYSEVQRIQADLIMELLPENPVICDLGCSTGTTIKHLTQHSKCPPSAKFIGYDNSQAILEKAREKLGEAITDNKVELHCKDLACLDELPRCHAIILNWTLQFVRPIDRETLIKKCFNALESGGALLLSEKIIFADPKLNRLFIDHYLQFKRALSGYTDTENQRKREALENVLIPYRLDENYALLDRAGFNRRETYFQWFNFVCIIAIKT